MKRGLIFASFLVFIISMQTSSAFIAIPEQNEIYNLGESLNLNNVEVKQSIEMKGFLKLLLNCNNFSDNFFLLPISLNANELKQFGIPSFPLTKTGNCFVSAQIENLNNEIIEKNQTSDFKISSKINVFVQLSKELFSPGEKLTLTLTAVKDNGQSFNGVADISLDYEKYKATIINGKESFEIDLSKSIKSGEHIILIKISDSNKNSGEAEKIIILKQIPTSLVVYVNNNSFVPGERIEAKSLLYDQASDIMQKEITLILYDSWGKQILTSKSYDVTIDYSSKSNDVPGNWWIYAYAENLKTRKYIEIKELKEIDIKVERDVVNITNIGNIAYKSPLTITFSKDGKNVSEVKGLDLKIGDSSSFKLSGDGEYNVGIKSANTEKSIGNVLLTGGVIGAKEIKNNFKAIFAIAFVFAIVTLAFVLRIMQKKDFKIKETVVVNKSTI